MPLTMPCGVSRWLNKAYDLFLVRQSYLTCRRVDGACSEYDYFSSASDGLRRTQKLAAAERRGPPSILESLFGENQE